MSNCDVKVGSFTRPRMGIGKHDSIECLEQLGLVVISSIILGLSIRTEFILLLGFHVVFLEVRYVFFFAN